MANGRSDSEGAGWKVRFRGMLSSMFGQSTRSSRLRDVLLALIGGAVTAAIVRYMHQRRSNALPVDTSGLFTLREESLLDITEPEHPIQERVLVAEPLDGEFYEEYEEEDPAPRRGIVDAMDRPDGPDPDPQMTEWLRDVVSENLEGGSGEGGLGVPPHEPPFDSEVSATSDDSASETDDLDAAQESPATEPDPTTASGTATLLQEPDEDPSVDGEDLPVSHEEFKADAGTVIAEAERIERDAADEVEATVAEQDSEGDDDERSEVAVTEAEEGDDDEGSSSPNWLAPIKGECPLTHQIKARYATGRYHPPGSASYAKVVADCCYATAEEAEADGFSRAPS